MITNSINNISASYLERMQDNQSMSQPASKGQTSSFAQLLGVSGADIAEASTAQTSSSSTGAAQMLNQLFASYQSGSVKNQGQSLDAMSIGQ